MPQHNHYFHFTIGPVQSFISQARRTRDFWAGSFLLSWLSGAAIKAVQDQSSGNEILFPQPDPSFIAALGGADDGPQQGNIPNRFKACVTHDFDAEKVISAIRDAWQALADNIWNGDIVPLFEADSAALKNAKAVWDRQTNGFWDIQWAMTATDNEQDQLLLDQRKHWRSHALADEPGVKCSLMSGWQEISGAERPGDKQLNNFWEKITAKWNVDFGETERLCAPAYIKRRFMRNNYFIGVAGRTNGWKLPTSVPSTTALAVTPWLSTVLNSCDSARLDSFHKCAKKLLKGCYDEWSSLPTSIEHAINGDDLKRKIAALDSRVFYDDALRHDEDFANDKNSEELRKRLSEIIDKNDVSRPSPFYALLLMDGDSLGKHLSDSDKQSVISSALSCFSGKALEIIKRHDGFLVYAGGDDLLALLPMAQALPASLKIKSTYQAIFNKVKKNQALSKEKAFPTTISAAIQYAHFKTPLTKIIADAHPLLDDKAKQLCGRDGLAIRVNVPGGASLEWVGPWKQAAEGDKLIFDDLRSWLEKGDKERASSGFFHRIREIFNLINNRPQLTDKEKQTDHSAAFNSARDLLTAEYLSSLSSPLGGPNMAQLFSDIENLLNICLPKKNDSDGSLIEDTTRPVSADGALIARFLASKGRLL